MSVRMKILSGFIVVFIIGLCLGLTGVVSIYHIANLSNEQVAIQEADTGVSSVLNAHYVWRQTLTEAVLNMSSFTGSLDPDTCALGKWKSSDEARNISDSQILSMLKDIETPHSYIHTEAKTIVALIEAGERDEAALVLKEKILPKTQETINILTSMQTRYSDLLNEKGDELLKFENTIIIVIIVLIIIALIASVLLAWFITASIMNPLRKMTDAARTISKGDLDVRISYAVNDEIGQLAKAFQEMIESTKEQVSVSEQFSNGDLTVQIAPRSDKDAMNIALQKVVDHLNNMFGEINSATEQVASGSKQIADGSQALAQGSTEQAAAVEQLSSSVSEIAQKTKTNAEMAGKAADLANTIKQNAEKGSRQMDEMMSAVKEINDASQSINKVIGVIDNIAFQTNILALNAAVEAARAGQHGKGFAVVAEEVRNLASKSADAAKETGALIANSMEKAELGARIAGETAASLVEIVSGINESTKLVGEIARSSEEQSEGISQVNRGIDQVAQVVQQNSATAEESAAASEELSGQSNLLEDLISQFKLKGGNQRRSLPKPAPKPKKQLVMPERTEYAQPINNNDFGKY